MEDDRWGFEDADDWEFEEEEASPDPLEGDAYTDDQLVTGQDADCVVSVSVTPMSAVVSVRLDPEWKRSVDPRGLHTSVLAAANAATLRAISAQAELLERGTLPQPGLDTDAAVDNDESPLTSADVVRLGEAVSEELRQFTAQSTTTAVRQVSTESAGGHVQGSAEGGQVIEISIEATWASSARASEIESELLEVLQALHRQNTPNATVNGPQGPAISEVMGLLFDPVRLARRVHTHRPGHSPEVFRGE